MNRRNTMTFLNAVNCFVEFYLCQDVHIVLSFIRTIIALYLTLTCSMCVLASEPVSYAIINCSVKH